MSRGAEKKENCALELAIAAAGISGYYARVVPGAEFSRQRMYANRKKAACAFQNKSHPEAANEIDEIIDFFDGVGFLVKRGALNKRVVWTFFFSYLYRFRHFADEYIVKECRRDPTLWADFAWRYDQLLVVERAERRKQKAPLELSPEDAAQFLAEETRLTIEDG